MSETIWDGATVLVTGGTGSFGRAFVGYALLELPVRAVRVFSRDERKQAEMAEQIKDERLRLLLGDVRDGDRLRRAFDDVTVVIHAAALKRVDAMVYDPLETIKTNIGGAVNVVNAALDAGVLRVLGISSDKACAPLNLYGVTKAAMEKIFTFAKAYAGSGPTRFACTRWGNVLGSRGSVLEGWQAQLRRAGVVQITDLAMTRFWMTLDEAVGFAVGVVEEMRGGEVFVPPVRAARVIDLLEAYFGQAPPYVVTGLRPGGEKLAEHLISRDEGRHARYRCGTDSIRGWVIDPDDAPEPAAAWLGDGYSVRSDVWCSETPTMLRALLERVGLIPDGM